MSYKALKICNMKYMNFSKIIEFFKNHQSVFAYEALQNWLQSQ